MAQKMPESAEYPSKFRLGSVLEKNRPPLQHYEELYRYVHRNAELSCMESRTAGIVAAELKRLGFEVVEKIGGHGVVGILGNGQGKTVLLRAELDGLPIKEATGLPYASTNVMFDQYGFERPVMHACGHDMHLTCLLGAAHWLQNAKDSWNGTLLVLFQPNEEHTGGAQAMIDDGLYEKVPIPDIVLGQHSNPIRSGKVNMRPGVILVAADTFRIRIFGSAENALNPQAGIDPIALGAQILVRLNSIISSEISPLDFAAIKCEEFHAGQPGLGYVDHADLVLDVKSYTPEVRKKLHEAIKRVVVRESKVSGASRDPEIAISRRAPLTSNDPETVKLL